MFDDDKAATLELHDLLEQVMTEGCDAKRKYQLLKENGEDVSLIDGFYAKALALQT